MVQENENIEVNQKTSFLRKTRRLIIFVFAFIILGIIALLSLLFVYEKEVKAAILAELNKHLKVEVRVDPKNIDLTIIKSFPYCSIEFQKILMLETLSSKNRDTLLYADKLNLFFNIRDLIRKKYEIRRIRVGDGLAKIKIHKNGKANYEFWEEGTPDPESKSTNFNLNHIALENLRIVYSDEKSNFEIKGVINTWFFKGFFKENAYDLATKGRVDIEKIIFENNTILKKRICELDLAIAVKGNDYELAKANLNVNRIALQLKGQFTLDKNLESANIEFHAPDPDITSVLSLLPETHLKRINDYESEGKIYAKGKFHYIKNTSYNLSCEFGIKNASIKYKPLSTTAEAVNIEGFIKYSNNTSLLDLKRISLKLKNDEIKASCNISNFTDPFINFSANADLHLENIQSFWPIDTVEKLEGALSLRANVSGNWQELKGNIISEKVEVVVDADISNLELQLKQDEKTFRVDECKLMVKEGNVDVRNFKLKRGNSDLTINGTVSGILKHIFDKEQLISVSGSLKSDYLMMEDFMPGGSGGESKSEGTLIPAYLDFKLDVQLTKFTFGKFEANHVSGEVEIKKQQLFANAIRLETMGGRALINCVADNSKNKLAVLIESTLENIDITSLFAQMNNFGQNTLVDKNLRGKASATIDFSGTWNSNLVCDLNSIIANGNLFIANGELINFEPMLQLSKFADVEDLKRIKFATLNSNVQIKNQLITFPKTTIKNSLLNIEASGTHSFDNEIDYHIQLLISEYLAKKRKKDESEFGAIMNDPENRRSAYIRMTGSASNPRITYDKQGLREKIKEDWKEERQTLKQILKEEFGLFKKDTNVRKQPKAETTFEIEKPEPVKAKKKLEPKKKKDEDEDF